MQSQEPKQHFQHLAHCLIRNHFRVDLRKKYEWSSLLNTKENLQEHNQKRRTIAVVGAGASIASGLPLAKRAIEDLKRELNIQSRVFDQEIERLESVYRLNRNEFETALFAFSSIVHPSDEVRDQLRKIYALRYAPLLSYEILAHMLKHRFLDAIISFNFDEILDQSIADELTAEEYYYIISDGNCPEKSKDRELLYALPIYLKPHGTVSHKSTLRYTREAYFGLPMDIRRVIEDLLSSMPVTLLVIGFNMQSFEFNQLVNKTTRGAEIFYINIEEPNPEPELSKHIVQNFVHIGDRGLDDFMKDLWQATSDAFRPEYKPRSIKRHELLATIFSSSSSFPHNQKLNNAHIKEYLHDRTIIELSLSIAKAKGLVNMSMLANDRCGKYYDLYRKAEGDGHELLFEMCKYLGLEEIGYSGEALILGGVKSNSEVWVLNEEEFNGILGSLYNKVYRNIQPETQLNLEENKERFFNTLLSLYKSKEIEIRTQADTLNYALFSKPTPIQTEIGLAYITEHLLKTEKFDTVLISAETGEWLLSENIKNCLKSKANIKIFLIVADYIYKDRIKSEYGNRIGEIKRIPWWEHNRHMTILIKDKIPISTIYFTRRLRSSSITPIFLSDADDSNIILESFIAYWEKADKVTPWIGRQNLDRESFFEKLKKYY